MTATTTHRATRENGPSVVEGKLVWTSASGITAADPNSYGGCPRRWWYEKVGGKEAPETEAMKGGTALHAEVEGYLRTGTPLVSPLALAGRPFIPVPGSNLHIERPIHFKTKGGVSIFGHVDLYNFRQEYIDPDGVLTPDPAYSFEVKDWKTTADFQYAKSERELAENIQLNTYAEAGFRFAPDMEHARLTHVYFRTKGRPEAKLVTIRRTRQEIASRWEYAEQVVLSMQQSAREPTAETVEGKRKACDAYRGCPHRRYCSVYQFNALDAVYGKVVQDHLQEKTMGILADNQIMQPAAPDTRAALLEEEARLRAQVAQQQQMMPQNAAELAAVCQRLGAYGYGFPALASNAAQAYAAIGGQSVQPGHVFPGFMAPPGARRSLHSIQLTEVGHIYQLEGELAAERGPVPAPVQYTPAAPPTQFVQAVHYSATPTPSAAPQQLSFLPPDAPESIPALAQEYRPTIAEGATPGAPNAPSEEPKKKRGRPAKALDAAPEATAAVAAPTPPPHASVGAPASPVPPVATSSIPDEKQGSDATCCILINARGGFPTKSLAPYVDHINAGLARKYNVRKDGTPGVQDVRCPVEGSVLCYGGWKGAVREVVKADPPPPDDYHLDTFADELKEIVADALSVVAERQKWLYVRGVGR